MALHSTQSVAMALHSTQSVAMALHSSLVPSPPLQLALFTLQATTAAVEAWERG